MGQPQNIPLSQWEVIWAIAQLNQAIVIIIKYIVLPNGVLPSEGCVPKYTSVRGSCPHFSKSGTNVRPCCVFPARRYARIGQSVFERSGYRLASRKRVKTKAWSLGSDSIGTEKALLKRAPSPVRERMPRFAANIAYLFSEIPLTERPAAAAKGGFAAVEGQFPYDTPASVLRAEIEAAQSDHARDQYRARRGGAVRNYRGAEAGARF